VTLSRADVGASSRYGRREFLKACALAPFCPQLLSAAGTPRGVLVDDVHTRMNATRVSRIWMVRSVEDVQRAISAAKQGGMAVSISGARHAAGGQQFGTGTLLLDMRPSARVVGFDDSAGTIEATGGTEWPALMSAYLKLQKGRPRQWGIAQKQGGLDELTLGGTLSANAHGHTLTLPPIVHDVESFELIDASGERHVCSRNSDPDLFRLAIGGYGLFGIISQVTLRLAPRRKLRRSVAFSHVGEVIETLEHRAAQGSLYGDFQYSIDDAAADFMERGILTSYDPTDPGEVADEYPNEPSAAELVEFLYQAHVDKAGAFARYTATSLASSGEVVWSDTHQYSPYPRGYHSVLDRRLHASSLGSDPLTEVYVPRSRLVDFFAAARREIQQRKASMIYGTVRLIERDEETFLPWARQSYACVIFTMHVDHTPDGLVRHADTFRALMSLAIERGGCYYLTYNRFADGKLLAAAYPQFAEFLRLKKKYDPDEMFQSDWYRYYREQFAAPASVGRGAVLIGALA
jgi:FAD/FMN-containing dehydrogenase